jgi:putative ABC transport system permease protein
MDAFVQDLRFALRGLTKHAGFTVVAVLTLALGIGVNSAMFTIVNGVVLRPLPFAHAERLVRVTGDFRGMGATDVGVSPPELFDYRDRADLFDDIAGVYPINANLTQVDQPERVEVLLVSPSYFSVLGAHAAFGRVFGPEDNHPGITEVVVISDALWKRRFGAAQDTVGRKLRIDDDWYTVVGIMPPGFRHPGRSLRTDVEMWAPSGFSASPFLAPSRGAYILSGAIARLKPGLTLATAQQQFDAFGSRLKSEFPSDYTARGNWAPRLIPLQEDVVGSTGSLLLVLLGAVSLVLLIACTNVAGLLLARAASRQRELAVRRALGSGRARLARLLLTESLALSLAGGTLGLLFAVWGVDVLVSLVPDRLPRISEIGLDGAVVAFTFGVSMLTGVIFGLVPALQFSNPDVLGSLRDARSSATRSRRGIRSALVVCEFALAMVLLVGAALLVRSFWRLQQVNPGVDGRGVVTARAWLPQPNDPKSGRYFTHEARVVRFEDILRRIRALPGVQSAAVVQSLPLDGGRGLTSITIEGMEVGTSGALPRVRLNFASPEYFNLMTIRVLQGRGFEQSDDVRGEPIVVINQMLAQRHFNGLDPIGKRLTIGRPGPRNPWLTVVAVVGNVLDDNLDAPAQPAVIRPLGQVSNLSVGLAAKVSGDPDRLKEGLARAVRESDPDLPVFALRTMDEIQASASASRRFSMRVLGGFAMLALILAAIGIYGVMSYLVSQRTREIGIRMALGARPIAVTGLVVSHALKLSVIGVTIGVGAALFLTHLMGTMLFQISPTDPSTFVAIGAALAATAVAAAAIPARRAASVDPTLALRAE